MKKTYEEPKITIELFSDRDVIVCSVILVPEATDEFPGIDLGDDGNAYHGSDA